MVTKSGQKTYGLDRFFSSLYGKPVPGLSFFSLSLISVKERTSYPVMMEQVVKEEEEKPDKKKSGKKVKKQAKKRGRPKGSKNKNRREVVLKPYLLQIQTMLKSLLSLLGIDLTVDLLCDGRRFWQQQCLTNGSTMFLASDQPNCAMMPPSIFPTKGNKKSAGPTKNMVTNSIITISLTNISKKPALLDGIQTKIYQMTMWHKLFPDLLNMVIIVKTNLKTQQGPTSFCSAAIWI